MYVVLPSIMNASDWGGYINTVLCICVPGYQKLTLIFNFLLSIPELFLLFSYDFSWFFFCHKTFFSQMLLTIFFPLRFKKKKKRNLKSLTRIQSFKYVYLFGLGKSKFTIYNAVTAVWLSVFEIMTILLTVKAVLPPCGQNWIFILQLYDFIINTVIRTVC